MTVPAPAPRHAPLRRIARSADTAGVAAVLALIAVMLVYLFAGGAIVGIDSIVAFYPMFQLLGERLRSWDLPLWNPTIFSGTPLAADPQSGWLYLPVMLPFSLFSIQVAAILLTAIHLLLAGLGTYALARALAIRPVGASIAAFAYLGTRWYTFRVGCCPVDAATASWLPVALLTTEMALRVETFRARLAWQIVTGFVLFQIVSVWFGQGAYYTLLAVGGYPVYRTLLSPARAGGRRDQVRRLAVHLGITGLVSLGLAAGGLLPRYENFRVSNLAERYPISSDAAGPWARVPEHLLGANSTYAGGVAVALALFGLLVLRGRAATPYWTALILFALIFSTGSSTVLHRVAYALFPMFERMQEQFPSRIIFIAYPGLAIMAGGVADALTGWRAKLTDRIGMIVIGAALVSYVVWAEGEVTAISLRTVVPVTGVVVFAIALVLMPVRFKTALLYRAVPLALLVALTVDLGWFSYAATRNQLEVPTNRRVDLGAYFEPAASARFLMEQPGEPFRFLGMEPSLRGRSSLGTLLYGRQYAVPITGPLIVNNRASVLGLEDAQGVNAPLTIGAFQEFFLALTGEEQNYHNATLLAWDDLRSPLLDLLNVRYIVVPQPGLMKEPDTGRVLDDFPEVYADDQVRILENPGALPRAWIVHEVRQVEPGAVLPLLASGEVNGAQVALIEEALPADLAPAPATDNAVIINRLGPEHLRVTAETDAAGVVVFSEIAHPGWHVFVDGERAELLTVDHALMGVAIPAGRHDIDLKFVEPSLRIGLAITTVTALAVVVTGAGLLITPWRRRWRSRDFGSPIGRSDRAAYPQDRVGSHVARSRRQ